MTKKSTFARNFRYFREKAQLGQEALAEKIGVNVRTISVYETGKGYPKVDLLIKISSILEVPVEHFFADNPENAGRAAKSSSTGLSLSEGSDAFETVQRYRNAIKACQHLIENGNTEACQSLINSFISAVDELETTYMRNKEIEAKLRYATELISSIANGGKPFNK